RHEPHLHRSKLRRPHQHGPACRARGAAGRVRVHGHHAAAARARHHQPHADVSLLASRARRRYYHHCGGSDFDRCGPGTGAPAGRGPQPGPAGGAVGRGGSHPAVDAAPGADRGVRRLRLSSAPRCLRHRRRGPPGPSEAAPKPEFGRPSLSFSQEEPQQMERTFIIIKPEGVRRGLIGEVLSRFERKGLRIARLTTGHIPEKVAREHYAHLKDKPFFDELVEYMTSGMVCMAIIEGPNAIQHVRSLIGATNPVEAAPGTIRGDFATELPYNIVHASDSPETAIAEIARFFGTEEDA